MSLKPWLLAALLTSPFTFASPNPASLPDTVSTLWNAMSGPAGAKADQAALAAIFHPSAMVYGSNAAKGAQLRAQSKTAFLQQLDKVRSRGFYECEISREVRQAGAFAQVLSLVESRQQPGQQSPVSVIGLNSIQLHRGEQGWQILSLQYYLDQPATLQQALAAGPAPRCLNLPAS